MRDLRQTAVALNPLDHLKEEQSPSLIKKQTHTPVFPLKETLSQYIGVIQNYL